jgi:hypothetical protein
MFVYWRVPLLDLTTYAIRKPWNCRVRWSLKPPVQAPNLRRLVLRHIARGAEGLLGFVVGFIGIELSLLRLNKWHREK